uniref:CCHC-type domain-containing protein n=1 Tax=Trichuris muris TaxID=70415 RepID=A0A5S6Q566_TRIMR
MAQRTGSVSADDNAVQSPASSFSARFGASPEPFDGSGDWQEWVAAFEVCSEINGWSDRQKLQWLRLRLIGHAGRVLRRLPDSATRSFAEAKTALGEAFQSPGQLLIHEMAFRSRRKLATESWATHAEALLCLAEKAYPRLDGNALDVIVNAQLLQSIEDDRLQLMVRRAMTTTVAESVRELMIQQALQCTFRRASTIASADGQCDAPESSTTADLENRLHDLEQSTRQLERLMIHQQNELVLPVGSRSRQRRLSSRTPPTGRRRGNKQCWNCQGFGHIARQCPSQPGNLSGPTGRTGRWAQPQ